VVQTKRTIVPSGDLHRAADDHPVRVLYLTFEELWVFEQFRNHAKQVFDGSKRVRVSKDEDARLAELELAQGDLEPEILDLILERFEQSGLIEKAGVPGTSDGLIYKFLWSPEDIHTIEIKERAQVTISRVHMKIIEQILREDGPDPNRRGTKNFADELVKWLKYHKLAEPPYVTLVNKLRGYAPKDPSDSKTLYRGFGVWYHEKTCGRWLLAFRDFLPVTFKVFERDPIRRPRLPKTDNLFPLPTPEPAPPPPPAQIDYLAEVEREATALISRQQQAEEAQAEVDRLERQLEAARKRAEEERMPPQDLDRLNDLQIALVVLKSIKNS